MSDIERTAPPMTALLFSMVQKSGFDVRTALCEFIDNALDSNAHSIRIRFGRGVNGKVEHFVCSDDGDGCTDMLAFVQLGGRADHESTRNGMYGVGGTEAQVWLSNGTGRSTIRSVSKKDGKLRRIAADWMSIRKSERWTFMETEPKDASSGERGTEIVITPCTRSVPDKGDRWNSLIAELGYLYMDALRDGVQLLLQRHPKEPTTPVVPWELPALEPGFVDCFVDVGSRKVQVRAGIVQDGIQNKKPGLTYTFGHRVVKQACAFGCGDYSHVKIAGVVRLLGRSWPCIATNKDDLLPGADRDALYAAVFDAIHPLLVRAQTKAMELKIESLERIVSDSVNALVDSEEKPDAKGKRGRGKKRGTRLPTGTGGKHGQAETEQDGETFPSKRGEGQKYRVVFRDFETDDTRPATFVEPRVIELNSANPDVKSLRDANDGRGLARYAVCALVLHDAGRTQPTLFGEDVVYSNKLVDRVMSLWGKLLMNGVSLDQQDVGVAKVAT